MSPAEPPALDYDALVAEYDASLRTRLRGFSTGPAFLEAFVPDEDPVRGVLSLLESARAGGRTALVVWLSATTCARIDEAELRQTAARAGAVTLKRRDGGLELHAELGDRAPELGEAARARVKRPHRPAPEPQAFAAFDAELHPAYQEAALALARAAAHEGPLDPDVGSLVFDAAHGGLRLSVAIDASSHGIVAAAHTGAASEPTRGVLEGLCAELVGLPMLEAGEHGALRLEQALSAPGARPPAPGITMPEHAGRAMRTASALLHQLLAAYRARTGFAESDSRFWPEPRAAWTAMDDAGRLAEIRSALAELGPRLGFSPAEVAATSVSQLCRVRLEFAGEISAARRRELLLSLEAELRRRVEPALVVEREARADLNVTRRL